MSESIRAYFVILVLASFSFWKLAKPYSSIFDSAAFSHLRNTWLILITLSFISPNLWVFVAFSTVFLLAYLPKNPNQKIIYYFLLVCALPNLVATIPGIGGINYFFDLSYNRYLIILLLLPVFLNSGQRNPLNFKLFSIHSDILIIIFLLLQSALSFRDNTVTNAMRESLMLTIDIFIPYYIISRQVNSINSFNRVLAALLLTISILALLGIFESVKHWLLYSHLKSNLIGAGNRYYLRSGNLRVITVFMSPIVFGYALLIGFGLLLYLKPLLKWKYLFYLNAAILVLALLATIARGPWLGFAVLVITYILTGKQRIKKFFLGLSASLLILPLIAMTPFWEKFVQLLPFVGTVRSDTIDYRQRLFDMSWIVFKKNPLFGSTTYLETPEMESMRQGEGIIDIVNSYIQIALENGLVGVLIFTSIFITLSYNIYILLNSIPEEEADLHRLGRVLLTVLVAIMFTISTVSSIDYIPVFYWAFAGLSAGYIYMARMILITRKESLQ